MTSNTFASLPLTHASAAGVAIPQLGFGVWEVPEEDVESDVDEEVEAARPARPVDAHPFPDVRELNKEHRGY